MNKHLELFILHLSLIENVGPSLVQRIIDRCKAYDPDQWYQFSLGDWMRNFGFSEPVAERIYKGLQNKKLFDQEIALLEREFINWITVLDPEYPELLKNIHLPPPIIYWRGSLPIGHNNLAVVGSRDAIQYGYDAIHKIVAPIVGRVGIISGGAIGIDARAHAIAVENGGYTAAILAPGYLICIRGIILSFLIRF